MPVSGGTGLLTLIAGGSQRVGERDASPVRECRTARPGSAPKSGPGCTSSGEPASLIGRALERCFVTVPTSAHLRSAGADVLSRSGQEIVP